MDGCGWDTDGMCMGMDGHCNVSHFKRCTVDPLYPHIATIQATVWRDFRQSITTEMLTEDYTDRMKLKGQRDSKGLMDV